MLVPPMSQVMSLGRRARRATKTAPYTPAAGPEARVWKARPETVEAGSIPPLEVITITSRVKPRSRRRAARKSRYFENSGER